ncbi:hypothetical protein JMUB7545_27730 [Staphylococcus aureus]
MGLNCISFLLVLINRLDFHNIYQICIPKLYSLNPAATFETSNLVDIRSVSYTHLTLPTTERV